jgi:hypothetical protein
MIGRDKFFRGDLAQVQCFNFTAASNLSKLISAFGVRDTKDLYESVPPTALVLPRLGSVSLATLGAAFEAKGLGGNAPLESWYALHRPQEATREFTTFSSLKHAEALREVGEKKAKRQRANRTAGRRDQAQRIRGDRYITRQEKNHGSS